MWEDLSEKVVPDTDPMYDVICEIANKIVQHNQDLDFFQKQKWTVLVINSPEENAFILPVSIIDIYFFINPLMKKNNLRKKTHPLSQRNNISSTKLNMSRYM